MNRGRVHQLQQQGYTFTGIFERSYNRDKAKAKAAELRKAGNKAVMVDVKGGTSVYWIESEKNQRFRKISEMTKSLRQTSRHIEDLKKELAEAETKYATNLETLQQLQKEAGIRP